MKDQTEMSGSSLATSCGGLTSSELVVDEEVLSTLAEDLDVLDAWQMPPSLATICCSLLEAMLPALYRPPSVYAIPFDPCSIVQMQLDYS